MSEKRIEELAAQALGRPIASVAERRLCLLLGAVTLAGGETAQIALAAAADVYQRMFAAGQLTPAPAPRPPIAPP